MRRNHFIILYSAFFCFIWLLVSFSSMAVAASSPVIFYSDLTSGPRSGGQDDKGAFVTIWGKHFGQTKGASKVTVGGGLADNYPEWSDQKICFQLGENAVSGDIVVITEEGSSNRIPFNVRPGNIYFVTPNGSGTGTVTNPFSPSDYIAKLENGEKGATAYFRTGTYSEQYAHPGWHANFCLTDEYSGTNGNENAFIAYPGEIAKITTSSSSGADRSNFRLYSNPAQYIVVSKFTFYAENASIGGHTGWRIVGNDINAIHAPSASGAINTGLYQDATPHNIYIYGNEIRDGSSGNKLDHAIYPSSGVNYLYIGWNYIHDNNFSAGPMISFNCNDAYNKNLVSKNIFIHDNQIDVSSYPARAIGVFETGQGSTIYEYNNVIIGAAPNGSCSVYAMSGNIHYLNNTFFHAGADNLGATLCFYSSTMYGHDYKPESIEIKNNIIYANDVASYYIRRTGDAPIPIVSHNLFYNITNTRDDDQYLLDQDKVMADPLFVNVTEHDFRLQDDSPASGNGQQLTLISRDIAGNIRSLNPSIGAYESESRGGGNGSGSTILSPPSGFKLQN